MIGRVVSVFVLLVASEEQHSIIGRAVSVFVLLVAGSGGVSAQSACDATGTQPYDYPQALCMSFLFYEAQRSGALPPDQRVTWRGDSALNDGQDVGVDLSGGYYDAGDYVKFGLPMASTVTVLAWGLLSFREGYEAAGQVEFAEDAIRWGTDYFLKAHSSPMTLWGQVGQGDIDHAYGGRPEEMTMSRPSFKVDTAAPGSDLAGETAAALAAASMVFLSSDPSYSATCLDAAKDLFEFADQYRDFYWVAIPDAANYYQDGSFGDEMIWAAAFLYQATGDSYYSDKALTYWTEFGAEWAGGYFGWENKFTGAQVLFAEIYGDDYYKNIVGGHVEFMRNQLHTPGGMVYLGEWGSLRSALNEALIAFKAAQLGIDADINRAWGAQQVNYALGSLGHSYIVGFGVDPPSRPHHCSSHCPDPPESCDGYWQYTGPNPHVLYGAMVGGPDENDYWVDDKEDWVKNEVACDYNAAYTACLAAMVMNV